MEFGLLLTAFPLGYLVRDRTAAFLAYIAAQAFLFTFQTLTLTREWVGGSTDAFAKDPKALPWSYGLVNLAIYAAGFGLLVLGRRVATKQRHKAGRNQVDLDC